MVVVATALPHCALALTSAHLLFRRPEPYHRRMATNVDPDNIETTARALDDRMESIRTLTRVRQQTLEQRAAAEAAEREDAGAYADALAHGWTGEELKKLGTGRPARRTTHTNTPPAATRATARGVRNRHHAAVRTTRPNIGSQWRDRADKREHGSPRLLTRQPHADVAH